MALNHLKQTTALANVVKLKSKWKDNRNPSLQMLFSLSPSMMMLDHVRPHLGLSGA